MATFLSYVSNLPDTSFALTDSAANVSANVDALQTNIAKLASVALTSNAPVYVTATEASSDSAVLSLLQHSGGTYVLRAANSGTVANFLGTASSLGNSSFALQDKSDNISASLGSINSNLSKIFSISITPSSNPTPLSLSASDYVNDVDLLAMINGNYTLNITGLNVADVSKTVTNMHVTELSVIDTAANLQNNLGDLEKNISKITSITVSNSTPLIINSAQAIANPLSLNMIKQKGGSYNLTASNSGSISNFLNNVLNWGNTSFAITDTSMNVSKFLDKLNLNSSKIFSITLSDTSTPLGVTQAQFINDTSALNKISGNLIFSVTGVSTKDLPSILSNPNVVSVSITDTALNLASNLNAMQSNVAMIKNIFVSDNAPLSVTAAQSISDPSVLSLIQLNGGSYTVQIPQSGSIDTFLSFNSQINTKQYTIVDTPGNISKNLDALVPLLGKISSINLSGATAAISLSALQMMSDASVLSEISSPYNLSVTGVNAANFASVLRNTHVSGISVVDTSGNIAKYLDGLQAQISKITSITTSNGIPLSVSSAQANADAQALAIFQQGGGLYTSSGAISITTPNSITVAYPNSTISGTSGTNTVTFNGPVSSFKLSSAGNSELLTDSSGNYGSVTLNNIQRLKFSDGSAIALDFSTGQAGFSTAIMIGTALGSKTLSAYFSAGISLYDAGQSNLQVATLIENAGIIESQLSSKSNTEWFQYIYKNIFGTLPSLSTTESYVSDLNNHVYSKAQLLAKAADAAAAGLGTLITQLDLVGLQHNGIVYNLPPA